MSVAAVALLLGIAAWVPRARALSFTQASYSIPGTSSDSFAGVAIGDLDNQKGPDLVVPQHSANQVWVLLNDASGTFGSATAHTSDARGTLGVPLAPLQTAAATVVSRLP